MRWTLASRSPERSSILKDVHGMVFDVAPVDFDETPAPHEGVGELVWRLARGKAQASSAEGWVVAADTLVAFEGRIMGKPSDRGEAEAFLKAMSSAEVKVLTATALRSPTGLLECDVSEATLLMKTWTEEDRQSYLDSGLWERRAGGFSVFHEPNPVAEIRGRMDVVRGIHGDWVATRWKKAGGCVE